MELIEKPYTSCVARPLLYSHYQRTKTIPYALEQRKTLWQANLFHPFRKYEYYYLSGDYLSLPGNKGGFGPTDVPK